MLKFLQAPGSDRVFHGRYDFRRPTLPQRAAVELPLTASQTAALEGWRMPAAPAARHSTPPLGTPVPRCPAVDATAGGRFQGWRCP